MTKTGTTQFDPRSTVTAAHQDPLCGSCRFATRRPITWMATTPRMAAIRSPSSAHSRGRAVPAATTFDASEERRWGATVRVIVSVTERDDNVFYDIKLIILSKRTDQARSSAYAAAITSFLIVVGDGAVEIAHSGSLSP